METIVVGYDETPHSERALDRAVQLSQVLDARLILTSVAPVLSGASARGIGPIDPVDPPEAHVALLDRSLARLRERGVEAEVVVGVGDPARGIVELAEKRDADMIVVGTREAGFVEKLLSGGSVSEGVAHRAHCDVLIVH